MDICEMIREKLLTLWRDGVSQQEIADKAQISQQHMNRLINGKSPISALKLETVLRLFPKAKLILDQSEEKSSGMSDRDAKILELFHAINEAGQIEAVADLGALKVKYPAKSENIKEIA